MMKEENQGEAMKDEKEYELKDNKDQVVVAETEKLNVKEKASSPGLENLVKEDGNVDNSLKVENNQ